MGSLQGYVTSDYDTLVKAFGKPDFGPNGDLDGKVTCEWELQLDGLQVRIYDWKLGSTPKGKYDWHVGGDSRFAVQAVLDALQAPVQRPFPGHTNSELQRLHDAAALLADFAEGEDRDEFDTFYEYAMEFETALRERGAPGYT